MDRGYEMKAAMRNEIDELKKRRSLLSDKIGDMPQGNGCNEFEQDMDEVISQLESEYDMIIKCMKGMRA